jgi:hypothetical protein
MESADEFSRTVIVENGEPRTDLGVLAFSKWPIELRDVQGSTDGDLTAN